MNVLMVEPGKAPYETQIGSDLQSMQALVGGYIQAVYPLNSPSRWSVMRSFCNV